MKFRKITSSKYIGESGFSIQQLQDSTFAVLINSTTTTWGTGFRTVDAAINFVNSHDYIKARTNWLPISPDDAEFIIEMYTDGNPKTRFGHKEKLYDINDVYSIGIDSFKNPDVISINLYKNNKLQHQFTDIDKAIYAIDSISDNRILATTYLGTEFRPILAAKGKSPRDVTRNLVRVKSSNVWAYGIEMKNNKIGDVYIQFKGKNGGPEDIYCYYDVPVNIWRKVLSHPSKGHAVWQYLRNNFLYRKLTGDKRGKLKNALN